MNQYGLKFHHFGLAVRGAEKAVSFLKGLGYGVGETVFDPLQNVNLIMCKGEDEYAPAVEIIFKAPANGGEEQSSPLDSVLSGRSEIIYHLCYETRNLSGTLEKIKAAGFRVLTVSSPKPAALFGGGEVSFYMIKGFGLIEILEKI